MNQLDKLKQTFARKGYQSNDTLTWNDFLNLLSQFRGSKFDEEIATELWEQAELNPQDQATVADICSIIAHAQAILVEKLEDAKYDISQLLVRRKNIEDSNKSDSQRDAEVRQINGQLDNRRQDKNEFQYSLDLVTTTFGIGAPIQKKSKPRDSPHSQSQQPREGEYSQQMQYLFYVTVVMAFIEILVMYKKYDFLNLMVVVTVMSIFLLNYFDNTYLKLCGGISALSVVTDFAWLIMYSGSFWSPSAQSQHSPNQFGYLKLIVLLVVINVGAKVYLVYLISKQWSLGAGENFVISPLEGVNMSVVADNDNIITRSCRGNAGGYL